VQTSCAEIDSVGDVEPEAPEDQNQNTCDTDEKAPLQHTLVQEAHARSNVNFDLAPRPPSKSNSRKTGRRLRFGLEPGKFASVPQEMDKNEDMDSDTPSPRVNKKSESSCAESSIDIDISRPPTSPRSRRCKENVRRRRLDQRKFVTDSVWECARQAPASP